MSANLPRTVPCPVCEMPVKTRDCRFTVQAQGRTLFFCSPGCQERFQARSCSCSSGIKGWWGRYLERLGRVIQGQFGASGPKCH